MAAIISVENVSKFYRLGTIGGGTLRGDLSRWWARVRGKQDPLLKIGQENYHNQEGEFIWALREISFEVEEGEVLGIIGRNGAGKSTLLKILSRVTAPTSGEIKIDGRIASLLEVGTGFHPELTGRENIYLNGAILGMTRNEVKRKFDEIVAFSEVEQFIDTPVKRYSSGMYVRLAFAVAAHLEPEILIVDEVLAVGDAAFQKKCLGKMGDVARQGRTVLFVSHNMAAVSALCRKAFVLHQGRIIFRNDALPAVQHYLQLCAPVASGNSLRDIKDRQGKGPIRFTSFHCENALGEVVDNLISGQPAKLILGYTSEDGRDLRNVGVSIVLYSSDGQRLANLWNEATQGDAFESIPGSGSFICTFPSFPLRTGRYLAEIYCYASSMTSDWIQNAAAFDVTDGDYYQTGKISRNNNGCVFLDHSWSCHPAPSS